jgi:hypothetical protein
MLPLPFPATLSRTRCRSRHPSPRATHSPWSSPITMLLTGMRACALVRGQRTRRLPLGLASTSLRTSSCARPPGAEFSTWKRTRLTTSGRSRSRRVARISQWRTRAKAFASSKLQRGECSIALTMAATPTAPLVMGLAVATRARLAGAMSTAWVALAKLVAAAPP